MSALSNDDFAKEVFRVSELKKSTPTMAYYDPDGDCIEFLATNGDFYAERIDDLVTVYYSEVDDKIVGSLIKGVSHFLKKYPNLNIVVQAGRVRLSHLFLASLLNQSPTADRVNVVTYEKLFMYAEAKQAEAQICMA